VAYLLGCESVHLEYPAKKVFDSSHSGSMTAIASASSATTAMASHRFSPFSQVHLSLMAVVS